MNYDEICDYRFWISGCPDVKTLKLVYYFTLIGYGLTISVMLIYLILRRLIWKAKIRPVDKMVASCLITITLKSISLTLIVVSVPSPRLAYTVEAFATLGIMSLFGQFRSILVFVVGKGIKAFTVEVRKTEKLWFTALRMYFIIVKFPISVTLLWLIFAPNYEQYKIARLSHYLLAGLTLILNIPMVLKFKSDIVQALQKTQKILNGVKNKSSIKKKKTSEPDAYQSGTKSEDAKESVEQKQFKSNEDRIIWISKILRLYVLIMCVYSGLENLKTAITIDTFAGNIYYDSICTVIYHCNILGGTIFMLYIAVGNQ